MNISIRRTLALSALAIAACAAIGASRAQEDADQAPGEGAAAISAQLWPSRFYVGDDAFTVYPPQLERWERDRLEGRAAVAVQAAGAERPVFGVVLLSARTDTDEVSGIVTVHHIDAGSGRFPTAPDRAGSYTDAVRRQLSTLTWRVPLERLQSDLAIDKAAEGSRSQPLRNDPPRILYVQSPTILVPVDGEPVLREVEGLGVRRVLNTRALILQDKLTSHYFLYVAGYWLEATALDGRWTQAQVRPMGLDEAKQQATAEGAVDLLEDDEPASARVPKVIVTTAPAELVQTDGPPQYAPIGSTELLFVTNSPNRLFLDLRTQTHYVLLAGRWYRTASLSRGPWDYVPGASLPGDFAMIPAHHPTESVRVAVPGTPESQEATIANGVPEIATVKRSAARLEITYDGAPQFRPIDGTVLEAAANAPVPVIRVDSRTYYALDNGVWFFSDTPEGPWTVATLVPPVVYTIPRSHPLHYVTYVRVYDATPEDVYVGYTPGYVGSYVTTDSTVVYGTGWYYRPWIGTVWYAPPVTWGFGFSFWYSWWNPWPRPVWWAGWRPVPCFRPAWGPWPHGHVGVTTTGVAVVAVGVRPTHIDSAVVRNHDRRAFHANPAGVTDIYRRWDRRSVPSNRPGGRPDAQLGARATRDRDAAFNPQTPSRRDDQGLRLDRNQWAGSGQRSRVDAPHWVNPHDRVFPQNGATPSSPPALTRPARPQAGVPPSPAAAAGGMPRAPRSWTGSPNASGPGQRQFDGHGQFEGHRQPQPQVRRWASREGTAPPVAQDPRPGMPPRGLQQPRGFREAPPGLPDATRSAPSRQHDARRDWTPPSPAAIAPPTDVTAPPPRAGRSMVEGNRGSRDGPGFGARQGGPNAR